MSMSKVILSKPWGSEVWLDNNEHFVIKYLYINPGEELSLQYHREKFETMIILEGAGEFIYLLPNMYEYFEVGEQLTEITKVSKQVSKGDKLVIEPKTIHKIVAYTPMKILEVSTPQVNDIVRVEDKYGRN